VSKNRAGRKANADKPITILVFPGLSLMRTIQVNSDTLFVRCPGCGASATHSAAHPPAAFGHENDRCPVLAADSGGNGRGAGGDRGRGGTELMSTEASLMDAIDVTYPPRGSQIVLLINWDLCRAEGWGASDADWDTFVLPGLCQPLGRVVINFAPRRRRTTTGTPVDLPPTVFEALVAAWTAILRADYQQRHRRGDAGDATLPSLG
jgi:hypothetical protein